MEIFGSVIGSLADNLKSVTLAAGFLNGKSTARLGSRSIRSMSWEMISPPRLLQRLDLSPHVCTFSTLPNWIRELGNLSILKIAVRKLCDGDVDVLCGLPALTVLSLHVRDAPEERIVHKREFTDLNKFKFSCTTANLAFEEGAIPSLRWLVLGFCASGGAEQQHQHGRTPVVGMEHLLSLEVVTARIDGSCADEADRMAAESALKSVVTARIRIGGTTPVVNICWVDRERNNDSEESSTVGEDQPADNAYPTATKNGDRGHRIIETSSLTKRSFTCCNPGILLRHRVPTSPWERVLVLSESYFSMFSVPETGLNSTPAVFFTGELF